MNFYLLTRVTNVELCDSLFEHIVFISTSLNSLICCYIFNFRYRKLSGCQCPPGAIQEKLTTIERNLEDQKSIRTEEFVECLCELKSLKAPSKLRVTRSSLASNQDETTELESENQYLTNLTDQLQRERDEAKKSLSEKQAHIENCMCLLQKNKEDVTNLSKNVSTLLKEKEKYCQELCCLGKMLDNCECKLNVKDNEIKKLENEISDLKRVVSTKEKQISKLQTSKSNNHFVDFSSIINEYVSISHMLNCEVQNKNRECRTCTCNLQGYLCRLKKNNQVQKETVDEIMKKDDELERKMLGGVEPCTLTTCNSFKSRPNRFSLSGEDRRISGCDRRSCKNLNNQ